MPVGKKRSRRIAETNTEFEQALVSKAAVEVLQNREDDELFVLDRSGSKTARRKIEKEESRKEMGMLASATEEHLVRKKMKEILERGKGGKGANAGVEEAKTNSLDIWGEAPAQDESLAVLANKNRRRLRQPAEAATKKAIKVTGNGFSYNPAAVHHQDALAKATTLETSKREKDAKERSGFERSNRVSHAAITGNGEPASESESESDDSDDEDDEDDDEAERKAGSKTDKANKDKKTKKEKLSVAQRNKQKAHRALLTQHKSEKALKGIDKQIENWPSILKAVEKGKKQTDKKRAEVKCKKEASKKEEKSALSYEESADVPLSDELGGSLRTLIPKGSNVKTMSRNYDGAGKTVKKNNTNNKKGRHPHRAPNVKWIARHRGPGKYE